jgi:DNA-binding transcriptional MerR regulator
MMPYKEYKVKKVVFTIGDVAEILQEYLGGRQVLTSTIRFWEDEFTPWLTPNRKGGRKREPREGTFKWNDRRYRKDHIEKFIKVVDLLYKEGYTLYGAKRQLLLNPGREKHKPKFDNFKMMHYE